MRKKLAVISTAAVTIAIQTVLSASPAHSATVTESVPTRAVPTRVAAPQFSRADYIRMARGLRASTIPRTTASAGALEILTFDFEGRVSLQIPYRNGEPYVGNPTDGSLKRAGLAPRKVTPNVKFGAVWWSAYVQLTSAEQAALAAGTTGAIVAVLSKNPLTVGLVTTIVSVATAEGICSRHRQLRIYIPSFLMSECI
jgi:hypothetical protein